MEDPGLLAVQFEDELVGEAEVARAEAHEPAEELVVVAGDVVDGLALLQHAQELLDDPHVGRREILLLELPDVDDVPVEDEDVRVNGLQVGENLVGSATAHAEVEVRDDGELDGSSWGSHRSRRGTCLNKMPSQCEIPVGPAISERRGCQSLGRFILVIFLVCRFVLTVFEENRMLSSSASL